MMDSAPVRNMWSTLSEAYTDCRQQPLLERGKMWSLHVTRDCSFCSYSYNESQRDALFLKFTALTCAMNDCYNIHVANTSMTLKADVDVKAITQTMCYCLLSKYVTHWESSSIN